LATVALGVAGLAVLLGLMVWQIQRLAWKEGLIARIEARLAEGPVPLPARPDPARDEFLRVTVAGRFTEALGAHGYPDAAYLTTIRPWGPGYRIVQPFETTDGRTILVDRGFVALAQKNESGRAARPSPLPPGVDALTGALRWPEPGDFFAGDRAGPADNVWLTRDVARLAPLWGAEHVLLVAETSTNAGPWPVPQPVRPDLPNDHLQYAVTWGLMAAVWAVVAGLLVRRELRR
jgi:surfeit locus 1 family protein